MFDMWSDIVIKAKKKRKRQRAPPLYVVCCLCWTCISVQSGSKIHICIHIYMRMNAWVCVCVIITQNHGHTGCVCVFMGALSDYICDLEHSTPQWPSLGYCSSLSVAPTPSSSSLPHAPRGTAHLHKGGNPLRLWSSTLFISWSAMIDALLIQI